LFRLIHGGSSHGGFPLRPYGGALFRPGETEAEDAVARALFILEHKVTVNDATIFRVLRKLLRGPLPVLRGRSKTYVEGPVDYTELRTEFIGLIYEGLLDYRLKRTTEEVGPQVFLNLGRNPVLPLSVLEKMLDEKPKDVKDLFDKLNKEKATATVESDDEDDEDTDTDTADDSDESTSDIEVEKDAADSEGKDQSYLDAVQAARRWAREAITKTKLVTAQKKKETDTEYDKRIEEAVDSLIERVIAPGEFYLVRAGNTRKGTGTFYTRPQLAVPTVHRTLEPLCFDKDESGTQSPKRPEEILALKVCDPACGSASFLVAALHYLTDALYKSLCYHCGLDDPQRAAKLTLPFGEPATGKDTDATVPLPPDDPNRGEEFSERVQALLRRHVVERCIYGVDINPLAVEFASVSLWVETLDPELPFSFLDHKIKVGNSLVGCWLNRVQDYPIMAWSRLQRDSDKKGDFKEYSKAIKSTRDETIKPLVREWIKDNGPQHQLEFAQQDETVESVHRSISEAFEGLHALPMSAAGVGEREAAYQELVLSDEGRHRLKTAMDAWCSIWFWSPQQIDLCPLPNDIGTDLSHKSETLAEVERVAAEHRFFHWELEFPDVFHEVGSGFDAMIGNPPWETSKPSSMEFFTEFDPIYRTYSKQDAKKEQKKLFERDETIAERWREYVARFGAMSNWVSYADNPIGYHPRSSRKEDPSPFNLMDAGAQWRQSDQLHAGWKKMREKRFGYVESERQPFRLQGAADINLYKLFLELGYQLLGQKGRLGLIVPSSLYTDSGTKNLREQFLERSSWEWLFSFENRKKIFDIHGSFKFAPTIVAKISNDGKVPLKAAFMVHDLSAWESSTPPVFEYDRSLIPLLSPRSKSLPEVRTETDLSICETVYEHAIRIGDQTHEWEFTYCREFDLTNDSKLFPPLPKWQEQGFQKDVFGRWVSSTGEIALPLFEGRMIGQFDVSEKGWVSGKGRTAKWRDINFAHKDFEPQYLIGEADFLGKAGIAHGPKLAFMDITSATNARTMISVVIDDMPCGNSTPVLTLTPRSLSKLLFVSTVTNSLTFDFAARQRTGGLHLNWFVVSECPLPTVAENSSEFLRLCTNAARLTFLHRRYAKEWLLLKPHFDQSSEWKHLWAVTEEDRLRLRVECDALVADLFGLDVPQCDWLFRNDPTDPKGFWRVEKDLPYEERLTGLSARGFRALKEGKWSAETVGQLSNDEFFDLLGIPELTNAEAAQGKGLSGPLILKREGCHSWQPEHLPNDDPRYGWTWDDCRNDAITLLGSEEALEEYIAESATSHVDETDETDEPFRLVSDPPKKNRQKTLGFE